MLFVREEIVALLLALSPVAEVVNFDNAIWPRHTNQYANINKQALYKFWALIGLVNH